MQDLVSFVQSRSKSKREDLAGEVLALLLREEPGQRVLRSMFRSLESQETVEVVTQRRAAGCVPDVHLLQNGKPVGLLELKFWASLTSHQLSGRYFDVASEVVFVVPEERVDILREELAPLALKHCLSITSWRALLERLATAVGLTDTHDERLFISALEHIKEFCSVVEKEHFAPFTADELRTPAEDNRVEHLVWLTHETLAMASQQEIVSEAGRLGAGFDTAFFYGQTVMLGGFRVWFGYWPQTWKQAPAGGPLWVQLYGRDATTLSRTGAFSDAIRLSGNQLAFPMLSEPCAPACTQEDEVSSAVKALSALASRLSALPKQMNNTGPGEAQN